MLSNHLILYCPLLLLPSIFPTIQVFSNNFVYLLLAVLSLRCCTGFPLFVAREGPSLVAVCRLLIAVSSLVAEHGHPGSGIKPVSPVLAGRFFSTEPYIAPQLESPSCSVAKLYLTLCDPMGCSMPGFPVLHHPAGACSNSCTSSQ